MQHIIRCPTHQPAGSSAKLGKGWTNRLIFWGRPEPSQLKALQHRSKDARRVRKNCPSEQWILPARITCRPHRLRRCRPRERDFGRARQPIRAVPGSRHSSSKGSCRLVAQAAYAPRQMARGAAASHLHKAFVGFVWLRLGASCTVWLLGIGTAQRGAVPCDTGTAKLGGFRSGSLSK